MGLRLIEVIDQIRHIVEFEVIVNNRPVVHQNVHVEQCLTILAVVGSHLFCLSIYLTDMLHLVSLVLCYYAAEGQKSEKQEKLFHTQFLIVNSQFLMFGSSNPIPFFLSTAFRMKPRMRAATPRQASITKGAV